MSVKYVWWLLALFVVALGIKFWLFQASAVALGAGETVPVEAFQPCLPQVTLDEKEFLADDSHKIRLAKEALEKAENIQKTMSLEPSDLWKALEKVIFAEEMMKNCKNPDGSLQIRAIDLKSSLLATQKEWVQVLQMEVLRNRRKNNPEKARFCLNKLLRLVPDEKHPAHQRWLKELLP